MNNALQLDAARKDPIIITDDLIGREVYIPAYKWLAKHRISYSVTINKRYKIVRTEFSWVCILLDNEREGIILINNTCAYLGNQTFWLLAARTSHSQKKVYTQSGRRC